MTKDPINILLVDDQPAKLLSYEAILQGLGENLIKAGSAREAFEHLLKEDIAIVLSDVCMPELDGFELARMIRNHPRFQHTAIAYFLANLRELPVSCSKRFVAETVARAISAAAVMKISPAPFRG